MFQLESPPRNVTAQQSTLFREHLSKGNVLCFRALGGSMWPYIRSGDVVHVVLVDHFAVGDVYLYEREHAWYVHRLMKITSARYEECHLIFQGDALLVADPPVTPKQVLGRVTGLRRGDRYRVSRWRFYRLWRFAFSIRLFRTVILPRTGQALKTYKAISSRFSRS